jgi:hypothetical protein
MATKQLDIEKIVAEDFASKQEAALLLGIAERTLERWLQLDDAPQVTLIGKKPFFEKRALDEFKRKRQLRLKRERRGASR